MAPYIVIIVNFIEFFITHTIFMYAIKYVTNHIFLVIFYINQKVKTNLFQNIKF